MSNKSNWDQRKGKPVVVWGITHTDLGLVAIESIYRSELTLTPYTSDSEYGLVPARGVKEIVVPLETDVALVRLSGPDVPARLDTEAMKIGKAFLEGVMVLSR
jgi:hypothetical protein